MIEMSVDKETVLPSEQPGGGTLPPPPQQHSQLYDKCSENHQKPLETAGDHNAKEDGSHQSLDCSIQSQNGVQLPKTQPKLNKRRSTMSSSFKHPIFGKRRRRANSESSRESVLPTNFLLGGNIFDPLNLNSLLDEEVNRALNAETPKSSPLPAKSRDPVEILIPRDITDPLNLNCCTTGDGRPLLTPLKSGGRRRHRNRHHGGVTGIGGSGKGSEGAVIQLDLSEAEKGKICSASQTELPLGFSGPHLDCLASTTPMEEPVDSKIFPTQEDQCPSSTAVREEKDEQPTTASVLENSTPVVPAAHRQRKRKRTTSKSENVGASNCDKKSSVSGPGKPPQTNRTQGTGLQAHANHRKFQKNQQKPNQQQQQQKKNQQQHHQKKKFQYGNYDKYYGYRNPGFAEDLRLCTLKEEWFKGKEVLDLGCNTGRITLTIARNWRPSRIVGLDIDGSLIHAARQNIRYYLSEMHILKARSGEVDAKGKKGEEGKESGCDGEKQEEKMEEESAEIKGREGSESEGFRPRGSSEEEKRSETEKDRANDSTMEAHLSDGKEGTKKAEDGEREEKIEADVEKMDRAEVDGEKKAAPNEKKAVSSISSANGSNLFPVSFCISRGPIAAPPLPDVTRTLSPGHFPANVTFVKANYVLESDVLLLTQREEFDVILCLSVTKWVHLNWGDMGLKRFFQRVYRHLRPGGLFILEPQPWHSYSKRKKLTDTITKNYYSIRLKPEQFSSYLTGEVGFSSYELIGTPNNLSRGFQRPIYLFHKGPTPRK